VAAISALALGVCLLVIAVAYGVILATTERTPRELAWTVLPAVLLAVLLAISAQAVGLF
jgi:hypothetical protein